MTSNAALYAAGNVVRHGFFVAFFFQSETVRIWNGYRNIMLAGQTWQPAGPKATVTTLEDPISDSAPQVALQVSGVDEGLLAIALSESDQVRGRMAFIYDQYFDVDWNPVGSFENYAVVMMDNIIVTKQRAADDSWERVIKVPSEYLLVNGPSPVGSRYSPADQALRYPDVQDNYFNYIPSLQNKLLRWPTF